MYNLSVINKTESEKEFDQGDESDKSDHEDESANSNNEDDDSDSDKDSDAEEDQTAGFEIRAHDTDLEQPQPELQSYSPSVTITSHKDTNLTVVPLLDTIQETQEDNPADKVMESPPTTTITTPTMAKELMSKELLKKAIQSQFEELVKLICRVWAKTAVSDFVQPCLERIVLDVIKKNPVY
ncbi:hypothetical protein Tco_0892166 [Tanacetum coccineum]|uniref:Uncharacterized protein n=1 Tax=Tanacetum coccineum TaxID=301880 RepID=A0ABQ5CAH7_9ASTR